MIPDRCHRPKIHPPVPATLRETECKTLHNGIETYILNDATYDVLRVDFIFNGGTILSGSPLFSDLLCQMLKRGTETQSAEQIARRMDFYGASLEHSVTHNHTMLTLNTTSRFAEPVFSVLEDILKHSTFPHKEYLILRKKAYNNFREKLSIAKKRVIRRMKQVIYGPKHPYGRSIRYSDFRSVNLAQLQTLYRQIINSDGCRILLTGHVTPAVLQAIEEHFGRNDWHATLGIASPDPFLPPISRIQRRHFFLPKDDAEQSTIAFAGPVIERTDPDWYPLDILTSILGGYFGSRLMKSVREQYGYTYNIHADIHPFYHNGYVYILTETASETTEPLIQEVFHQMDILRQQPISIDELSTVKAYLSGEHSISMDGLFSHTFFWLSILQLGWSKEHFYLYEKELQSITAERLQETAKRWLRPQLFQIIICGKKTR